MNRRILYIFLTIFSIFVFIGNATRWSSDPVAMGNDEKLIKENRTLVSSEFPLNENITKTDWARVVGADQCGQCHKREYLTLQQSMHWNTWEERFETGKAKRIGKNLNLDYILKNSDICYNCHGTAKNIDGRIVPISGVSCEMCHNPGEPWWKIHNNFGGLKEFESAQHAAERWKKSEMHGMLRPNNLYDLAVSCVKCHTVPNEELVNVGRHNTGSDFNMVAWSQGIVRHNFLRSLDEGNRPANQNKLRKMYIIGAAVHLEYNLRRMQKVSKVGRFRTSTITRILYSYDELKDIFDLVDVPFLEEVFNSIPTEDGRPVISRQLLRELPDKIKEAAKKFDKEVTGENLGGLDATIKELEFIGEPIRNPFQK